jgi:putative membrane protein
MKRFVLSFVVCVVAAMPAFAQSIGERSGVNSALGMAPKTEDFVKEVAISDMFEVDSSKLAQQKSDNAAVKDFASHMVMDHTKTSSELKGLVQGGDVKAEVPAALDSSHQSKLDKLKGLNGADFNKQYISDQQSAHSGAVSLFERYSTGGENPTLKDWAGKTLPALQSHKRMADGLKS